MRRPSAYSYYLSVEALLSLAHAVSFTVTAVYFVRELDLSPVQLVLVGTAMEAAVFVFEVPTGVVADTYSRRASLIAGWTLMGSAMIVVGTAGAYPVVLAGYALWGLGYTFTSGAYEAWITDEVGVERMGRVFLRGAQVSNVGALAGIGLSVAIASVDLGLAIAVGGAISIAVALASIVLMPETGFRRTPPEERRGTLRDLATTARTGGRYVRAQPILLLMLAIFFFAGASSEALDRLWEAHFIRDVGLPGIGSLDTVVWFGLFAATTLLMSIAATQYLIKRFSDADHRTLTRLLTGFTIVALGALVAFALAGAFALAIGAYLVYRLARSIVVPLELTWLNQQITDSRVRATVISITGQSDAVGQVVGGPAIGAVGNAFGIRAALLTGAALLAPALALFGRALRHGGREEELDHLPAPVIATTDK